jgi:hypothetical protein
MITDIVMMPGKDYQAICDAVRAKTGGTELLKSGDIPAQIEGISGGGEKILYMDAALLDAGGPYPADADDYTTAVIPAEATFVSLEAFDNLPNIDTVIINGDCEFETYGEYDSNAKATTYYNVFRMSHMPIRKVIVKNRTTIESHFLAELYLLEDLVFENCGIVNNYVCYWCTALKNVELGVTGNLGMFSFGYTKSLRDVVLPESCDGCYRTAFNSSGLKTITFLSMTASYEQNAFDSTVVVRGYAGSEAQSRAEYYGHTFEVIE